VLVQYVPHAFGWKAMNVPFCLWLWSRRRDPVWVMFHEVAFPLGREQPLPHNVLGLVNRLMSSLAARAAERILVSIPAWEGLLPRRASGAEKVAWLPVPSNIPTAVAPGAVLEVRRQVAPGTNRALIGHFGTFGEYVTPLLAAILPPLLWRDPQRLALLIGRGSERFAADLTRCHPALVDRLCATGELDPAKAAAHLAACDCLVQPFPDGASTRRTSLMAGLALGVPVVTTAGPLTEPFWREIEVVVLVPYHVPLDAVEAVERLLGDPARRIELGRRAAAVYERRFSLSQTIRMLRSPGPTASDRTIGASG
jgi:glycosyltransferase involved in cell wall biosynthesis